MICSSYLHTREPWGAKIKSQRNKLSAANSIFHVILGQGSKIEILCHSQEQSLGQAQFLEVFVSDEVGLNPAGPYGVIGIKA